MLYVNAEATGDSIYKARGTDDTPSLATRTRHSF
jgi:hypothetical protein